MASRDAGPAGRLALLAVPTIVIARADDEIVPVDASRTVAESIRGGRLLVALNCGHRAREECPERGWRR